MGMENARLINACIPVVQFQSPTSGICGDLTIGNLGGVENSKILAEINRVLPDFYGVCVYLVKEWTKKCDVVAPDKSMLNSFTMTTMTLTVLQELDLLPILLPTNTYSELTLPNAQRTLDTFQQPHVYEGIEQDDVLPGVVVYFCFLCFAEYYSKFDFNNSTVNLMYPRRHRSLYAKIVKEHIEPLGVRRQKGWGTYLLGDHGDSVGHPPSPFPQKSLEESMRHEVVQRQAGMAFAVEDFVNYVS
ncbi:LOW QUALITY PROTEIN: hypothetical protein Q4I32_003466 [Leishmania shawi]|uniref:RNA uridylyltransferase n=1 Tax=Leishmania shawi TaxID=5680 RepID=A0AAW3BTP0_9TRYP